MILQGILKVTVGAQGKKRFKADGGIGENVGHITAVNYDILTTNIKNYVESAELCEIPSHCIESTV